MRKALLIMILSGLSSSYAFAQNHDKWLHFGAGVVAGGAGAFVAHEISGGNKWWTIAGAVGTSLVAGMAKEAIDKNKYGTWDNGDLAATVAGGVTVGVAIELFSGRKKRKAVTRLPDYEHLSAQAADPFQKPAPNRNSLKTSHD